MSIDKKLSYNSLIQLLLTNERIILVNYDKRLGKIAQKLYYALSFDERFYNKITILDSIAFNSTSKTIITSKFDDTKQIIFLHYTKLGEIKQRRKIILLDVKESLVKHFDFKFSDSSKFNKLYNTNFVRLLSFEENRILNPTFKHRNTNKILIFDTETNGIPLKNNNRCCNYFENPLGYDTLGILQLSWIVVDLENDKVIKYESFYVKNENIKNTISAENINHISDITRSEHGLIFSDIYEYFIKDVETVDYIVTHGSDFDFNFLVCEIKRNNLNIEPLKNVCILNTKQNLLRRHDQRLSDLVKLKEDIIIKNDLGEDIKLSPHDALYDSYLCYELFKIRML